MTINIALVTNDALVVGCDSVASATGHYLNPEKISWDKDANNKLIKDANGKYIIRFKVSDLDELVINSWGGVTKMFQIHPPPSPVVAVTSGLANVLGRPISSLATEFFSKSKGAKTKLTTVEAVANAFLKFVRSRYQKQFKGHPFPALQPDLDFLVGGIGKKDAFPSLYRVEIKQNKASEEFAKGRSGVSWNGQSDSVERFIRGYDSFLKRDIEKAIKAGLDTFQKSAATDLAKITNDILAALGAAMPPNVATQLSASPGVKVGWDAYSLDCDYSNVPIQDAVQFVAFLAQMQAGKSKFASGVPTVGGRIHIGVVTKAKGFELLNEPQLVHRHTGFIDDV